MAAIHFHCSEAVLHAAADKAGVGTTMVNGVSWAVITDGGDTIVYVADAEHIPAQRVPGAES